MCFWCLKTGRDASPFVGAQIMLHGQSGNNLAMFGRSFFLNAIRFLQRAYLNIVYMYIC